MCREVTVDETNNPERRQHRHAVARAEGHPERPRPRATSIHNIRQLNLQMHDHIIHFDRLRARDGVNPVNALKADRMATSELQQAVSPSHPLSSPGQFRDGQNQLKAVVANGQLGIFRNGSWDNPAHRLPPKAGLLATTHYLVALDLQREIVKIHTIFGGKNPHPSWLGGSVPSPINARSTGASGPLGRRLSQGSRRHQSQVEGLVGAMNLPVSARFPTLARTAVRALESDYCGRLQRHVFDKLTHVLRRERQDLAKVMVR